MLAGKVTNGNGVSRGDCNCCRYMLVVQHLNSDYMWGYGDVVSEKTGHKTFFFSFVVTWSGH